jgi:fluoroacetyl-CoA thioesterase
MSKPLSPDAAATATTTVTGAGKLHLFEVIARDAAGEVGRGRHRRAVVVSARLLEGARKRTGA